MKYLTLYWPECGSDGQGRNEIRFANTANLLALNLPTIEVENCGTHTFTAGGQTHTVQAYHSFINGKPSAHVGGMGDAIILGLEEHFQLSARGYRVRMKVASK